MWPKPRSGPSTAHYLLLAAIHRICQPGPKTEVADWYRGTVLHTLWRLPPERFSSQAFWDAFDQIRVNEDANASDRDDELDEAQLRLMAVWKEKQLVSRRLLAYDTTNFYTWVASTNERNRLAQRGHNKQWRHNLRQVGLSYVLDGENGLSLCHHVYAGNVSDAAELPEALARILKMLDRNQIERDSVTLVFDKGTAALDNTLQLEQARVGWISALPWNQAPTDFRERAVEQLLLCSSNQPGVRAAAEKMIVHGKKYLCVLKYSSSFAGEQLHSVTTSLSKVLQSLRRLSMDLAKPASRLKETQIGNKIRRWLSAPFLQDLIRWQLDSDGTRWRLQFDFDYAAFQKLLAQRLGRTVLLTNRMDWTAEQVVAGYSGQQQIEQVFRGLKEGDWLGWGPMHHWTDTKIRVHAFYCMLGISLLKFIHKEAQTAWPGLSMEQLLEELRQIRQFILLYPPQGEKGPPRAATVLSKQSLPQQQLAQTLGLEQLGITQKVGKTDRRS
ncbi:MAG: IS1634 family transposase [Acidobacteria bacterium]|nr:IS1634 family transposase [Acidobacteriota bacterium]